MIGGVVATKYSANSWQVATTHPDNIIHKQRDQEIPHVGHLAETRCMYGGRGWWERSGGEGEWGRTAALQKIYALCGMHSTCVPDLIDARDSGSIVCLPLQGPKAKLCCLRIAPCTATRRHLMLQHHCGMTTPGNSSVRVLSGLLRFISGYGCRTTLQGQVQAACRVGVVQSGAHRQLSVFQLPYPVWMVT